MAQKTLQNFSVCRICAFWARWQSIVMIIQLYQLSTSSTLIDSFSRFFASGVHNNLTSFQLGVERRCSGTFVPSFLVYGFTTTIFFACFPRTLLFVLAIVYTTYNLSNRLSTEKSSVDKPESLPIDRNSERFVSVILSVYSYTIHRHLGSKDIIRYRSTVLTS